MNDAIIITHPKNKYVNIIKTLCAVEYFSRLGGRQIEVLALFWQELRESRLDTVEERYDYIFNGVVFKNSVCRKLEINLANYYNIIKILRAKGFLDKTSIEYENFILTIGDEIIFSFIDGTNIK